ncbi:hypothetical protein [Natrialba swarupiae]|uniref:Uncharacterized protein n=1 Tax=Natrialba swarupiae TaxID=2448032 RepID=A0A5D5AHF9_9EURY|nr:hypothetical protein [Natrialba swarupiae]TYT60267.1 hypothetical protein FYC77_19815 [Natrialba swarupiae]
MSNKKRISGSVDPEVAEYLDSVDNKSAYINEIIKREMSLSGESTLGQLRQQRDELDEEIEELEDKLNAKKAKRSNIVDEIEELEEKQSEQKEAVYDKLEYALKVHPSKRSPEAWSKAVTGLGFTTEQFDDLVSHALPDAREDRDLTDEERERADEWLDEH